MKTLSLLGIPWVYHNPYASFENKIKLQVNDYMELPPFNYPNPLGLFGGAKQVKFINSFSSFIFEHPTEKLVLWYGKICQICEAAAERNAFFTK